MRNWRVRAKRVVNSDWKTIFHTQQTGNERACVCASEILCACKCKCVCERVKRINKIQPNAEANNKMDNKTTQLDFKLLVIK